GNGGKRARRNRADTAGRRTPPDQQHGGNERQPSRGQNAGVGLVRHERYPLPEDTAGRNGAERIEGEAAPIRDPDRNRPPHPRPTPRAVSDCWRAAPPPAPAPAAPARSRSRVRGQTAKAALAAAIFFDRALECGPVEIRPIDRYEHELAIGGLPQQEIR